MAIPLPTVHATQGGIPFCTAFASAAAGFYFLGQDASLHWAVSADPRLDEIDGSTVDRAVAALIGHGAVPWSACPGYGDKATAQAAVNPIRTQLAALAKGPTSTEQLYYNQDTLDIDAVIRTLDMGYPILATADLQDLYELDASGSTRFTVPNERKGGSHAVCIVPEYQRRPDGIYVRYVNSFGSAWGDRGTGWALLCTGWYQMWAVIGKLYDFGGDDMSVTTYSLKKDGGKKLSENFKVSEFACKDGNDAVLIDDALVAALQAIRDHFGKAVNISSAYRTKSYNSSIGGASNSQHLYGTAADFRVTGVTPREVAKWAEANLWDAGKLGGLGLYDYAASDKAGFVHVDTRQTNRAQWVQIKSSAPTGYKVVGSITRDHLGESGGSGAPIPTARTLKRGMSGADVAELVDALLRLGYAKELAYDSHVEAAVKAMQRAYGLAADGVYGTNSREAMETLLREANK